MRFQIRTRPDGKFVEGICHGAVTGVSMVDAITEMRLVDGYSDGMNALWDFREADLSTLTVEDMKLMLDYMEQTPKRRSVRIAILALKDADFLLLKLWRVVSRRRYGQTTNVFSSHEDACKWLEESQTPDD